MEHSVYEDETKEKEIVEEDTSITIVSPKRSPFRMRRLVGRFLIVVFSILYVYTSLFSTTPLKEKLTENIIPPNPFLQLNLEAKAFYVYDVNSQKELYGKNEEVQWPLASLTKLMTAVAAIEAVPESTVVTITNDDIKAEGDTGFKVGDRWQLGDLLKYTLLVSSNDGATAAAALVSTTLATSSYKRASPGESVSSDFVVAMNEKGRELNLRQTYFINETGLDANQNVGGSYGSARDVALLFAHILKKEPELLKLTRYERASVAQLDSSSFIKGKNTNKVINQIPGVLGSKTGYTDLAGGNLVVAFDAGFDKPIVISVLGSSEQGRFDDVLKLVWGTLDYLQSIDPSD